MEYINVGVCWDVTNHIGTTQVRSAANHHRVIWRHAWLNIHAVHSGYTDWKQVWTYYRAGTDNARARRASGQPADAAAGSGGQTWNNIMAAILNVYHHNKIQLSQSMHIYLKQFCQISFRYDFKWRSFEYFLKRIAPTTRTAGWVAIWDPDPIKYAKSENGLITIETQTLTQRQTDGLTDNISTTAQ